MRNQKERDIQKKEESNWMECPICLRGNARSPKFKSFPGLMRHLIEHKSLQKGGTGTALTLDEMTGGCFVVIPRENRKGRQPKIIPEAVPALPAFAEWLEQALDSISQLNSIRDSSILVADQLVKLVEQLPREFKEQREYLLQQRQRLKETGMDPDWPRTPGSQARFVAQSMAGTEWSLTPSSSREYIRRVRGHRERASRSTRPKAEKREVKKEGRWWESAFPELDDSDS